LLYPNYREGGKAVFAFQGVRVANFIANQAALLCQISSLIQKNQERTLLSEKSIFIRPLEFSMAL